METLATAAGGSKTFLDGAGVAFGFGMVLARVIHGGIGQAHDHPPDHPQHSCRWRAAHAALVLVQRDVQTMVQPMK